jgi:GT2 family glycosyltransferase
MGNVDMLPTLSVVIPTLNRPDALRRTLADLLKQDYPVDRWEIIVVDQSDVQVKLPPYSGIQVRHLLLDRKQSGAARNKGVEEANGEIIVFLDDDVEILTADFLRAHAENYRIADVGAVAGRVLQPWDKPVERIRSWQVGRVTHRLLVVTANFNWDKRLEKVEGVQGCNFSVRKDVYRSVGGFDTAFPGTAYFEETDLAIRVRKAGYRIVFEPRAVVKHLAVKSGGQRHHAPDRLSAYYWYFHNYMYLFSKHGSRRYLPLAICYALLRGAYASLKHRSPNLFVHSCIRGLRDGLRYSQRMREHGEVEETG